MRAVPSLIKIRVGATIRLLTVSKEGIAILNRTNMQHIVKYTHTHTVHGGWYI